MKKTIKIQNLKCGGCAHTIKTKLLELKGVKNVDVIVNKDEVVFNYDLEPIVLELKQKLKALGYPEMNDDNSLVTKAKSFVSCATGKLSNHEK
ncbi:heavy-metal-associated domain-containing protein [Hanstruepera ponticola]|uniref:heavy-metal-associated domain-containing protein n=1 Tax=Hanstruepera ponticola TaxID=2042995 RepID=UPI001784B332|nr:heavy metal-associated domain-containing protein [Hanstruepera ponticola]